MALSWQKVARLLLQLHQLLLLLVNGSSSELLQQPHVSSYAVVGDSLLESDLEFFQVNMEFINLGNSIGFMAETGVWLVIILVYN